MFDDLSSGEIKNALKGKISQERAKPFQYNVVDKGLEAL